MILSLFSIICLSLTLSIDAKSLYDSNDMNFHSEIIDRTVTTNIFHLINVLKMEFRKFQKNHNKIYKTEDEKEKRFSNFILSLVKMEHHNNLYWNNQKKYQMKINRFSDWSQEELSRLNGLKVSNETGSMYLSPAVTIPLPDSFDWREHGAVTEVKDQNYCGSCYAFSSTGALEGQIWRKTGKLISLSEQQIIDCDKEDDGCDGGWMSHVFEYIRDAGGLESEKDYHYTSGWTHKANDKCYFNKTNAVATDTGFVRLPLGDEEKLREALVTIGPIAIAISVPPSLHQYSSGIFHDDESPSVQLNHAVLLVGYGTDKVSGTPYWIIKNSWGPYWGESGYFRLERNKRSCNMGKYSVYPLV